MVTLPSYTPSLVNLDPQSVKPQKCVHYVSTIIIDSVGSDENLMMPEQLHLDLNYHI